ncbi:flagellin [Clostridium butyricum]|jgi:flagellin|uniref:flagellin N-terminal helical domain-containing protein n=1 Tax=Clostridium butyricum TaxID=1492 RepID=UPI0022E3B989|nr:flagellin [Clostridium butyricum]
MIINHNLGAMNAQRNMNINSGNASKSMEKLSSGLKINRAGDDAAGLSISEKMRAQIRGLDKASTNAEDGISLIQTAEGALNETHSILQRMRELSVQAANDTNVTDDRTSIKDELDQLSAEVDRIATTTEFNTKKLLNTAGNAGTVTLQVGANEGQTVSFNIGNMQASSLGVATGSLVVSASTSAQKTTTRVDNAIKSVSAQRSKLGAMQNRLEHTINNLNTSSENLTAAESRIRDTDMASEMSEYSKNNILQQASQAMLAQAKSAPQSVLQLLQ